MNGEVLSSKDKTEQQKSLFKRAVGWVDDKRAWLKDYFESPEEKCHRILKELDKRRRIGDNGSYNPYNDPNALTETAEKLIEVTGSDKRSVRICLTMALEADPNHEKAKKLLKKIGE